MAKGISDCACERGVFSDQNLKVAYNGKTKLIVVDCNADPKSFEQGEWNVILLFNYLWSAMHASPGKFNIYDFNKVNEMVYDARQRLTKVKDNLIAVYKGKGVADSKLTEYLDRAYIEIDTYAFSLGLYAYLHEYQRNKQSGKSLFSPNTIGWNNYDPSTKNGSFRLNSAVVELEGQKTPIHLDVIVEDGNIEQYKLWDTTGYYYPNRNLIGKFKTFKENFKLDNGFIEKQFKDKLLSKTQIHNLRNFGTGIIPDIVNGNCYVNSVLQALHASATVRDNVKKLNASKTKRQSIVPVKNISPVLYSIFKAIEDGGMERYVDKKDDNRYLDSYKKAMLDLATCLEQSEGYLNARMSFVNPPYPDDINESIKGEYNTIYELGLLRTSTFSHERNCCKGGHTLRKYGTYKAVDTMWEITEALVMEAHERGIEPIVPGKLALRYLTDNNNHPSNLQWVDKHQFGTVGRVVGELKETFTEAHPSSKELDERQDFLNGYDVMQELSLDSILIIPFAVQDNSVRRLKTYQEIEETIYGKKHKYRLVASVDYPYEGHFFASVLTKDGWVRIDDTQKRNYTDLPKYEENPANNTAWQCYRNIAIYELVY